jgi:arginase
MSTSGNHRALGIVGYACDFGGTVAGSKNGPQALRARGLIQAATELDWSVTDYGDVHGGVAHNPSVPFSTGEISSKRANEVFSACFELNRLVRKILNDTRLPLVLGGDHSLSIGSVSAVADHFATKGQKIGLIWVDAHSDINTPETSPSGHFFGMSVAVLLGLVPGALASLQKIAPAVRFENLSFIGLRDVDPGERELLLKSCPSAFAMNAIDGEGIKSVVSRAIETASRDTEGFVLSFDLDACDPNFAPGTGTPKRGGLTYRECHYILERAVASEKLLAIEFVELNPDLDPSGQTADVALSLIQSALGKRIL